ncbi:ATPase family AAA domain-containing protein 5 [Bienertia sinuspersici]
MEHQADQTNQPLSTNVVDLQSPDRKVTRRKFVQTTLFPIKPHGTKVEDSSQKDAEKDDAADNNDDEFGGSQEGKRKRGRKPKGNTTPQKRGAKKVNNVKLEDCVQNEVKQVEEIVDDDDDAEVCGSQGKRKRGRNLKGNSTPQKRGSKKAAANGKDASVVAIDDTESPGVSHVVSEHRNSCVEISNESPVASDASPQQLKGKRRVSTRNGRTNGNKATSMSKVSTQSVATQQISQAVPDLWLEAKLTAEENSRIFAGKQIHPFFSSWKAGKKDLETIALEDNECLDKGKQRKVEIGPVHVFENVKDDLYDIDWSNWTFNDGIFNNPINNEERKTSVKGSVGSFAFDDIESASTSLLLKDVSLPQLCGVNEESSILSTSISPIVLDEGEPPDDLLKNEEKDFKIREPCSYGNYVSSHFEQENAVLHERNMSYHFNRGNYPDNSLWTNKYHPEKALEVCGNSEAVKFINDWLRLWHGTDFRFSKSYYADSCSMKDDEYDLYDSDSDVKNEDASGLKNVLLVTGPVGSGKSAAIYACAKEQGFQVIEINASDWRNGALLKQKFGEAVGSHWVKRSQESPMGKRSLKSSLITNEAAAQDMSNGVIDVISLLEEDDYLGNVGSQHHSNDGLPCDKGDIKTLILFEDVDVNLYDDRGLISTIQQLADTGKRPMILTSNSESPPLPDSLDREEVCFTMPSLKELAEHIHLLCSAEKANTQVNLIERCIEFFRGDIRKTLMCLQFWCQSKECMKDGKMRSEFGPLMFNLDAGHHILPKLIPWELPSSLSEFVEAEVAKSISKMEEKHSILEVIEEEEVGNTSMQNKLDCDIDETLSIEAKKEAILSGNCFLHVDNDIMAGSNACEFSNSSCSPVAFTRRTYRRKSDTVLSESEDEICNHDNSAVSYGVSGDDITTSVPVVHSQSPVINSASKGVSNEFSQQLLCSGAKEEAARHQSSETAHNFINFFAQRFSCNQSADPVVHSAEANPACLEFAHANSSGYGEAIDSMNLLKDQLVHTRVRNLEANMHQYPVADHEKFSTMFNSSNQSADQSFHFGDAIGEKVATGNAANLCSNPLSDQVQHHREEKITAKRCLFPQPAHPDPISGMIGGPRNQSTGQIIQGVKASMTEPPQSHLDMGTANHDGQLFDQLFSSTKVYTEVNEQPKTEGNPLCYTALGESLNPSNDQLFQFIEAKEKENQYQHPEAGCRSDQSYAAVDGALNQSNNQVLKIDLSVNSQQQLAQSVDLGNANCLQLDAPGNDRSSAAMDSPVNQLRDQVLGIDLSMNSQQQLPQIFDLNSVSFFQLDAPLSLISEQLQCDEEKAESIKQQLPDVAISCPAADNSLNPSDGKNLMFTESKAEGHQCQFSDATNINHVIDQCQSLDMSVVPESTFVAETEVNDGTECPSGTDLMDIVSPAVVGDGEPSIIGCQASEYRFRSSDLNVNPRDEEMGDNQSENEHLEPSTSGCPVMDACSRMDFFKRSKSCKISALEIKNSVQERWNELRKTDLGQYFLSENENALQLVELGYKMSNLISEGDLLLHDTELLINDSSGPAEETFTFGWLDQHVQMASSIAQYGYLLYAKDIDALQSKMGLANKLHLGWEMLVSASNSMALGKLLRLNRSPISSAETSVKQAAKTISSTRIDFVIVPVLLCWSEYGLGELTREREMCLQNIVQSVVPPRSFLAVRGNALHDYLSSLAQIARSEASRLAEAAEKSKRRRVRAAKNYLSHSAPDLSQDDISKLTECNSYRRDSSKSTHESSR